MAQNDAEAAVHCDHGAEVQGQVRLSLDPMGDVVVMVVMGVMVVRVIRADVGSWGEWGDTSRTWGWCKVHEWHKASSNRNRLEMFEFGETSAGCTARGKKEEKKRSEP